MRHFVPTLRIIYLGMCCITAASPLGAHVGPPVGIEPLLDNVGGDVEQALTSWGILTVEENGQLTRVCDEVLDAAIGVPQQPYWAYQKSNGMLLIGTAKGVWLTERGCDYERFQIFAEVPMGVRVIDPRDPRHVLIASTSRIEPNNVYESRDGGETFDVVLSDIDGVITSLNLFDDDIYYTRIDLESFGLSGFRLSPDTDPVEIIQASHLSQLTWLYREDDGQRLWISETDRAFDTQLKIVNTAEDGWVEEETYSLDGFGTQYTRFLGMHYLLIDNIKLIRWPGEGLAEISEDDFLQSRCLINENSERLWTCTGPETSGHFRYTRDGEAWESVLPFDSIEESRCTEGSAAYQHCAYLFEEVGPTPQDDGADNDDAEENIDAGTDGVSTDEDEEAPSCNFVGEPTWLNFFAFVVVLALFNRGLIRFSKRKSVS